MENELLSIMNIAESIAEKNINRSEDLCNAFNMSVTTLRRRLSLLRHFGVQIKSKRTVGAQIGTWSYRIENWQEVKKLVRKWKELEKKQDMLLKEHSI